MAEANSRWVAGLCVEVGRHDVAVGVNMVVDVAVESERAMADEEALHTQGACSARGERRTGMWQAWQVGACVRGRYRQFEDSWNPTVCGASDACKL